MFNASVGRLSKYTSTVVKSSWKTPILKQHRMCLAINALSAEGSENGEECRSDWRLKRGLSPNSVRDTNLAGGSKMENGTEGWDREREQSIPTPLASLSLCSFQSLSLYGARHKCSVSHSPIYSFSFSLLFSELVSSFLFIYSFIFGSQNLSLRSCLYTPPYLITNTKA